MFTRLKQVSSTGLILALIYCFPAYSMGSSDTSSDSITPSATQNVTIDEKQISVSGVSSGAYMAVQVHVAYSEMFMGVGSVAGGPYYCAEQKAPSAITEIKLICMMGIGADPTAQTYVNAAKAAAKAGTIDSLDNLKNDRIYIFNSQTDQVINPGLGYISRLFYEEFVSKPVSQVAAWSFIPKYGPLYPVAHGMPTDNNYFNGYENSGDLLTPCAPSNSQTVSWFPNQFLRGNDPWMYHCNAGLISGYSLANDILSHIYGDMEKASEPNLDRMYAFDQLSYVDDTSITTDQQLNEHGIGDKGYVYVPENCQDGKTACKLHVALHGCQQFPEWTFKGKIGSEYSGQTITFDGIFRDNIYNGIAEANNIVMVYPQAHNIGTESDDMNPYGCWEFWGFFDQDVDNYYTKDGREMKIIANVVNALKDGSLVTY